MTPDRLKYIQQTELESRWIINWCRWWWIGDADDDDDDEDYDDDDDDDDDEDDDDDDKDDVYRRGSWQQLRL